MSPNASQRARGSFDYASATPMRPSLEPLFGNTGLDYVLLLRSNALPGTWSCRACYRRTLDERCPDRPSVGRRVGDAPTSWRRSSRRVGPAWMSRVIGWLYQFFTFPRARRGSTTRRLRLTKDTLSCHAALRPLGGALSGEHAPGMQWLRAHADSALVSASEYPASDPAEAEGKPGDRHQREDFRVRDGLRLRAALTTPSTSCGPMYAGPGYPAGRIALILEKNYCGADVDETRGRWRSTSPDHEAVERSPIPGRIRRGARAAVSGGDPRIVHVSPYTWTAKARGHRGRLQGRIVSACLS